MTAVSPSTVFVDTSAFYAIQDQTDPHHPSAADTWRRLIESGVPLITTSFVVSETAALLQSRFGLRAARRFFEDALPSVEIVWVDEPMFARAVEAWTTAARRTLSLVDCASFVVSAFAVFAPPLPSTPTSTNRAS